MTHRPTQAGNTTSGHVRRFHASPADNPVLFPVPFTSTGEHHPQRKIASMPKVLLIVLCFFFPFLAVLIHDGPSKKVLWAFLLQLLGHVPGVIYGLYQVIED